ncbi:hypothetical protein [Corynebacterium cystitidis]|uniref:Uncharacterized protein n=1 Tax=Corynebacterium cystitidis DSM 20524 TaxID=1121357 RepID=A0A1H9RA85_9CORY|nr:hypothetical protein [Corynebacterium cystitidis]WJY81502.1 hypothetical protein CCYS_02665 [Corynebacterium cystitidis DSM 20524]SER69568.1 hypothetical protein SAMN05661109_00825 [Corynebacterium cystitidis DSM 20524]SNV86858.1 Uncharacterised protein [Corynebacterium cystitidis]
MAKSARAQSATITTGDWGALGAYAGIAAVLASPLRHYTGPIEEVNKKKNDKDSFPPVHLPDVLRVSPWADHRATRGWADRIR